jgi:hypothetical protein
LEELLLSREAAQGGVFFGSSTTGLILELCYRERNTSSLITHAEVLENCDHALFLPTVGNTSVLLGFL